MAAPSADEIVLAFVTSSAQGGSHVAFAERSAPYGYVRVYGPSADPRDTDSCHIIVERPNGAVSTSKALIPYLSGIKRVVPSRPIHVDPTGFAAGPEYGRFVWSVDLVKYTSAAILVAAVKSAFEAAGIAW